MVTTKAGGFGRENFGDPLGGGGPLTVVRAWPVSGRTVRVVFSEAPTFRTPAGLRDAMNPANYAFTIDAGQATAPIAVGVSDSLVVGPAAFVGNGGAVDERGVDVSVDRALVQGITYRVTVNPLVQSAIGGGMGSPNSGAFPGVVQLRVEHQPEKVPRDNVDIANDPFAGGWFADDSGDIAVEPADQGYRKRVIRRVVTPLNAYAFLQGYGCAVRLKEVASLTQMAALKAEIERQVALEPETATVKAVVTLSGTDLLTITISCTTKRGSFVTVTLQGTGGAFVALAA